MKRLEAIERLRAAATEGSYCVEGGDTSAVCVSTEEERQEICDVDGLLDNEQNFRNASFLAESWEATGWLLARVKELAELVRTAPVLKGPGDGWAVEARDALAKLEES